MQQKLQIAMSNKMTKTREETQKIFYSKRNRHGIAKNTADGVRAF